ncbi:hypothetical protein DL93DRAFT_2222740 [Clavulina sp. PMI_390]|nr:hypothetical protein DL93DRAFT_2222740 [Clavulina sp. PMI_390]
MSDIQGRFGTLRLISTKTGKAVSSFPVDVDVLTFGRDVSCDVRMYFVQVSSLHAKLVFEGTKPLLSVMGSGGVHLGGTQILPSAGSGEPTIVPLEDHATFSIHSKIFRFDYPTQDSRPVIPATPMPRARRSVRMSMVNAAYLITPNSKVTPTSPSLETLQSKFKPFKDAKTRSEREQSVSLADVDDVLVVKQGGDLIVTETLPERAEASGSSSSGIKTTSQDEPRGRSPKKTPLAPSATNSNTPTTSFPVSSAREDDLEPPATPSPRARSGSRFSLHKAVLVRNSHRALVDQTDEDEVNHVISPERELGDDEEYEGTLNDELAAMEQEDIESKENVAPIIEDDAVVEEPRDIDEPANDNPRRSLSLRRSIEAIGQAIVSPFSGQWTSDASKDDSSQAPNNEEGDSSMEAYITGETSVEFVEETSVEEMSMSVDDAPNQSLDMEIDVDVDVGHVSVEEEMSQANNSMESEPVEVSVDDEGDADDLESNESVHIQPSSASPSRHTSPSKVSIPLQAFPRPVQLLSTPKVQSSKNSWIRTPLSSAAKSRRLSTRGFGLPTSIVDTTVPDDDEEVLEAMKTDEDELNSDTKEEPTTPPQHLVSTDPNRPPPNVSSLLKLTANLNNENVQRANRLSFSASPARPMPSPFRTPGAATPLRRLLSEKGASSTILGPIDPQESSDSEDDSDVDESLPPISSYSFMTPTKTSGSAASLTRTTASTLYAKPVVVAANTSLQGSNKLSVEQPHAPATPSYAGFSRMFQTNASARPPATPNLSGISGLYESADAEAEEARDKTPKPLTRHFQATNTSQPMEAAGDGPEEEDPLPIPTRSSRSRSRSAAPLSTSSQKPPARTRSRSRQPETPVPEADPAEPAPSARRAGRRKTPATEAEGDEGGSTPKDPVPSASKATTKPPSTRQLPRVEVLIPVSPVSAGAKGGSASKRVEPPAEQSDDSTSTSTPAPKRASRKGKEVAVNDDDTLSKDGSTVTETEDSAPPARRRVGRPRKVPEASPAGDTEASDQPSKSRLPARRGRGGSVASTSSAGTTRGGARKRQPPRDMSETGADDETEEDEPPAPKTRSAVAKTSASTSKIPKQTAPSTAPKRGTASARKASAETPAPAASTGRSLRARIAKK